VIIQSDLASVKKEIIILVLGFFKAVLYDWGDKKAGRLLTREGLDEKQFQVYSVDDWYVGAA
jgi:hypothetical protein